MKCARCDDPATVVVLDPFYSPGERELDLCAWHARVAAEIWRTRREVQGTLTDPEACVKAPVDVAVREAVL